MPILHPRKNLYLRRRKTTDNHCLVIACDRSMTIPRCFETSISSPLIVLKLCYDVGIKWNFIGSTNNESSIICWCHRILIYFAKNLINLSSDLYSDHLSVAKNKVLFSTYVVKGKSGASVHWFVLKLYNSLLTWHEELEYDPVVNAKPS